MGTENGHSEVTEWNTPTNEIDIIFLVFDSNDVRCKSLQIYPHQIAYQRLNKFSWTSDRSMCLI